MRVTIQDVAKAANVTPSTVSRVIANSHLISAKTTQKVRRIMREMNYHPNVIARSLVRRSTNIVGVLLPGSGERVFQHPFYFELLRGITSRAQSYGMSILLSSAETEQKEKEVLEYYSNSGVADGAILMVSRANLSDLENMYPDQYPLAMIGRPLESWADRINWVDSDNIEAGRQLTRRFLQSGRRHIAYIGLAPEIIVTKDRFDGYCRALEEAQIPVDERLVVSGTFMGGSEQELTEELLRRQVLFDGIIAADDFQAIAAMGLLAKKEFHVPKDVAVAGFNNISLAAYSRPPLTSVDVNAHTLGEKAVELLRRQIAGAATSHFVVSTQIIERESI